VAFGNIYSRYTRKGHSNSIMPPVYTTDWQNAAQVKTSYFQTLRTGVEARIVGERAILCR